ncbi:MAG TPA: SH3 domain-containing protein [Anaerolineales bacterium]|nr:SH3 domain-containing protein [Anaerolineales bacterium]
MLRKLSIVALLVFIGAGCDVQVPRESLLTATPLFVTPTLPVTPNQVPSETAAPPPLQPTVVPVDGVTSTQVNVRAEPSTAGNVLGMIPAETRVEITGKDPGESWWQINYPQGIDGKGWVTAQYVIAPYEAEIPVIGGDEADPTGGNVAIVQQQLNVRSGPGTGFNSLGTLNPQDVVGLTGKDANGAWLQIDFPAGAGPDGKGWVNAAFVQAQGVENLPIVTETGEIVGTGTPTSIPFTPTPTVVPAREDQDSPSAPIASVIFEPAGTQTLIYNGEISTPQGDLDDWVAFKPYGEYLLVTLECYGSNSLKIEIIENTQPASTSVACGESMNQIKVQPGSNYLVHLQALPSTDRLQYTNYILTIKTRP